MKWNKAIVLGTILALSFTLTACNGMGQKEEVITEQQDIQDKQVETEDNLGIDDPVTDNPITENPMDENETPIANEPQNENGRFAEGAGEGIEHSDIKFPGGSFNTKHGDLTLSIEEGSITPTGLTLIYENNGDNEYQYGSSYYIEKNEEDQWTALPYLEEGGVMWTEVLYSILKDQPSVVTLNWETLYGPLTSGEYRIIKQCHEVIGTEEYDLFFQGVVFTIE